MSKWKGKDYETFNAVPNNHIGNCNDSTFGWVDDKKRIHKLYRDEVRAG